MIIKNRCVRHDEKERGRDRNREVVRWYSEPRQLHRITPGLTTNFSLSQSYSVHKSTNHKFSKIYKISHDTNLYKQVNQNVHTKTSHQ